MIKLNTLLTKLKNIFFTNIEDLKNIQENNRILEINKVKYLLETLEIITPNCETIDFYLTYHQRIIGKYYPTLTNEDTKLLFKQKSLILEKHCIHFGRSMILLEKLESKYNEKLQKLQNNEDVEDNYQLTTELGQEFTLFISMYMEFPAMEVKADFYDTLKILNIDIE